MTAAWIIVAICVAVLELVGWPQLPLPTWTVIHVITLGVLVNGICHWSWYFTRTLLRLPDDRRDRRAGLARGVLLNVSIIVLIVAMWTTHAPAAFIAACAIGAAIGWHGLAIINASRTRFGSRFAAIVRYYVAASAFLVVGCGLGALMTFAALDEPSWPPVSSAAEQLALAHAIVNVGGWVGLAITGTVVTLGPTMLRTRMDPKAVPAAVGALPWLAGFLTVAALAAGVGWLPGVGIGLLGFASVAMVAVGVPFARTLRAKRPREFPTWSLTGGVSWMTVGIVAFACASLSEPSAEALLDGSGRWAVMIGVGGIGQVLIGALSYLLPVMIGGGPQAVRTAIAVIDARMGRLVIRNAALLVLVLIGPHPWLWALIVLGYAVDVMILALACWRQARVKRSVSMPTP